MVNASSSALDNSPDQLNLTNYTISKILKQYLEIDGIGAAASILGIITAAPQSTKYIYQVIAGIKDAPTVIKELGKKIGVLEDTLFRIKHIQRPSTLLKDRIEKCQRDLAGFTIRVEKMSDAFDGTSLSQKIRKGTQVWFKEDKFLAMNKTLDEYRKFFILEMNANTMETSEKYADITAMITDDLKDPENPSIISGTIFKDTIQRR
ncbi:Similar to predicted protein [Nectria haematococca mpVI 77-13-4]; acc. no. XP_003044550 [Pyronema omphalodes CBS 100304]|uniref:Azaphilone pigments biosynthesis cluster protein L N-terminal domain-containing protein n=1 Tax=Pyronema omphalodes (strain CBS 100304) TaxID=1076935 RepID=U4L2I1_PYROM|nr:Similar to predicted protein [Nectria haematococca mpVI 77-13-4]; acc. no. XP_003044550 [Pyronema omphalodes CBS 100304]